MSGVREGPVWRKRFSLWWLLPILGVALVGAALLLASQQPPYKFLRGFELVDLRLTPKEQQEAHKQEIRMSAYRRQVSFNEVVRRAEADLLPLGFTKDLEAVPNGVVFSKGSVFDLGNKAAVEAPQFIGLFKDLKLSNPISSPEMDRQLEEGGKSDGWVSVAIMGQQEQTLFDKFRVWVGL